MVKTFTYLDKLLIKMSKGEDIKIANKEGIKKPLTRIDSSGGRKSGKTQAIAQFLVKALLLCNEKHNSISGIGVRHKVADAGELFDEILQDIEDNGWESHFSINRGKRTIKIGHSKIRVIGLKSNTKQTKGVKAGLASFGNARYGFTWVEEAFEVSLELREAVRQAVRGKNPNLQKIEISSSNPWALGNDFVKECNSTMPYEEEPLRADGEQFGVFDTPVGMRIVHYVNHRVNEFLQEQDHKELEHLWYWNPQLARVADLGMPGIEKGAIYPFPDRIQWVDKDEVPQLIDLNCGIDVAYAQDKTVSTLVGWTPNFDKVYVLGIHFHDPKTMGKKDEYEQALAVNQWLLNMQEQYKHIGLNIQNIKAPVDYGSNGTTISGETWRRNANQIVREGAARGVTSLKYIEYTRAHKYLIHQRVTAVRSLMGQSRMYFVKDMNTNLLYDAFQEANWEEGSEFTDKPKRNELDFEGIDFLDSFEYAIASRMNTAIKAEYKEV